MAITPEKTAARWLIIAAGTILQLCLGTVYAWSYFQKPLGRGLPLDQFPGELDL